jgi:phosphoglycolate phosphatase-like HAD superfamily hydrolase
MRHVSLPRFRTTLDPAPAHAASARSPHWAFPLTVKAILLDLDGTLMPTYQSLAALRYVEDQLELQGEMSFVEHYGDQQEFETLLHDPAAARRAAIDGARERGVAVNASTLRGMRRLQEQSFRLYEGLRDLLNHARRAGVFVGIYTNTSCERTIRRLQDSLLPPEIFSAIWAKDNNARRLLRRDYTDVLVPYDYCKPDDRPLRDIASISGARTDEILLIGDGVNDFDVVYRDKARPQAIFCLQEKGAADISDELAAFNARLRPGHVPLGIRAINNRIDRYGIDREIIRLSNGFIDLLELINTRRVALRAPDRLPIVRNNRLSAQPRCSTARFLQMRPLPSLLGSTAGAF